MGRLLILFFALPWWMFFPLAGGTAWLGERAHSAMLDDQAQRAAALEAGAPDAVDIGAFNITTDRSFADEVTLRGWIDAGQSYELEKTIKGVSLGRRFMYVLFGENDPAGSEVARGAIVLTEAARDKFVDQFETSWVDFSRNGYIFEINGFARSSVALDDLAFSALDEKGLSREANFVFLEPFLDGRAAALEPATTPQSMRQIFWVVAIAFALIGTVKRVFSVLFRKHSDDPVDTDSQSPNPAPASATFNSTIEANSPLGRLSRKQAVQAFPDDAVLDRDMAKAEGMIERSWDLSDPSDMDSATLDAPDFVAASGKGKSDIVFLLSLLPAMGLVGALAYDPALALAYLKTVTPVALIVLIAWRVMRLVGHRSVSKAG